MEKDKAISRIVLNFKPDLQLTCSSDATDICEMHFQSASMRVSGQNSLSSLSDDHFEYFASISTRKGQSDLSLTPVYQGAAAQKYIEHSQKGEFASHICDEC